MSAKALIPIVIVGGVVAAVVIMTRRAEAAPPPEIPITEIITADKIMNAKTIAELNAYYNLAGELFIIGKINYTEYRALYDAYYERWYQLTGVSE